MLKRASRQNTRPATPSASPQPTLAPRFRMESQDAGLCVSLAALILIVFGRVLSHEFINLDDLVYISQNRFVNKGLSMEGVAWAFTHFAQANWHPLTWITHMLDCQLFGLRAGAHAFMNVVIHAASSVLLYVAIKRMTSWRWGSAAVAALFALHPLRVESVAWVSERKDVLSGLCFMLLVLAYIRYVRSPSPASYVLLMILFAAGLMAKPMLVTVPFVLLLLDFWPLERLDLENARMRLPRLVREKLPLLALSAASSVITVMAQRAGGAVSTLEALGFGQRLQNAAASYVRYLGKIFWPVDLAIIYPMEEVGPLFVAGAALVILVLSATTLFFLRRRPYLAVGWFWFLGMLVPVIGIVQVGTQSMADRYTYLPSIGISIAVVFLAREIVASWETPRRLAAATGIVVLIALSGTTVVQAGYWRDSVVLFRHALEVTDQNGLAHTNLGLALFFRKDRAGAAEQFQKALTTGTIRTLSARKGEAVERVYPPWYAKAFEGLGLLHLEENRPQQALAELEKARRLRPRDPQIQHHLGRALYAVGRKAEAMALYEESLTRDAGPSAKLDLGIARLEESKSEEALALFDEVLREVPGSVDAHNNRGSALARLGREMEAMIEYEEALRLDPTLYDVHLNIGALLSRDERVVEANRHFADATRLRPDLIEPKIYLALGYLQADRKADAIPLLREMLRSNPADSEATFCKAVRRECNGRALSDFIAALEQ